MGAGVITRYMLTLLHGQVFFVLGLSIVLLARRNTRLEIARGLFPFAIFGFCEALAVWISAWFVADDGSGGGWARVILLGMGYTSLLALALQTCVPSNRQQREPWLYAGGLWLLWGLGLLLARSFGVPSNSLQVGGEIAVRYGLALPGGLLGAWGLRRQTYRTIAAEQLDLIKPRLRVIWVALGAFAVFGGVIVPRGAFFPANLLNEQLFLQVLGVPVSLLRALCGAAITYGVVCSLSIVLREMEIWLEDVEQIQALALERERIGRDLHDGTIQSIYAAGLMLEGARYSIDTEPEVAKAQLTRAIESLNQTIQDIRRYIFNLRGEMPADNIEASLRQILKDFRVNTLLETEFVVGGENANSKQINAEQRQHIFQIAREALTNVARHARARRVRVSLQYNPEDIRISFADDGVGLSVLPINKGHGLRNIRERTRLLGGNLDIHTAPDEGMTLVLIVPYDR
ncbi:MAG TPA: hypothetical protein ENN19_18840 [Chloroflexi bacterium]|nr:hypothetical protein [Chloroflexota bacterium]